MATKKPIKQTLQRKKSSNSDETSPQKQGVTFGANQIHEFETNIQRLNDGRLSKYIDHEITNTNRNEEIEDSNEEKEDLYFSDYVSQIQLENKNTSIVWKHLQQLLDYLSNSIDLNINQTHELSSKNKESDQLLLSIASVKRFLEELGYKQVGRSYVLDCINLDKERLKCAMNAIQERNTGLCDCVPSKDMSTEQLKIRLKKLSQNISEFELNDLNKKQLLRKINKAEQTKFGKSGTVCLIDCPCLQFGGNCMEHRCHCVWKGCGNKEKKRNKKRNTNKANKQFGKEYGSILSPVKSDEKICVCGSVLIQTNGKHIIEHIYKDEYLQIFCYQGCEKQMKSRTNMIFYHCPNQTLHMVDICKNCANKYH